MSAFGSPWGDIDRTRPDAPYVVDSDGWGWFALFIMLALPIFIIGLFILRVAKLICMHPYMSISIYLAISLIIGIFLYSRGNRKWRVLGVFATIMTLIPLALVEGLYMIPYIMQNSLFASVFEWFIVTAFMGGLTFFVLMISNVFDNGIIHLIFSAVFIIIVSFFLNKMLSSSEEINWTVICSIYHWKTLL